MSFVDSNGYAWSILFDGGDPATTMFSVTQAIVAVIGHLLSHNNAETIDPALTSVKRMLPSVASTEENPVILASGMATGIYVTAYEIGDWADYPTDMFTSYQPLYKVSSPDDVAKVK
jgi:hypothetical protein